MRVLLREALGYGAASAVALGADMSILWLLVHYCGWGAVAAATVSFMAGAVVAYQLSVRLAFRQHRLRDRRAEFLGFVAIGSVGVGINAGVVAIGVRLLGLHYIIAKCIAAGFTFTCNFLARRQLLFVRRPGAPQASHVIQ